MGPHPGELIIHDGNFAQFVVDPVVDGEQMSRGHMPRDFEKVPYGSMPFAAPFDLREIKPGDYQGIIEEKVRTKSQLSDIWRDNNVEVLNQNGTNYCWFNGPVSAMYAIRAANNQPFVKLSPASGAAPIKGFRNVGGWGTEALEWIVRNGVCRAELWPPNAIDRRYYTDEAKADAKSRLITEWYDLRPRNVSQLITCLLLNIPVAVGYNWWGHEVCALDAVWVDGAIAIRIVNSWGASWSDRGMGILQGSKLIPDDQVAPRVVNATVR